MINTRLTSKFDLEFPIVLAPMNHLADARLARAVTRAGGLGLLGGGYGDRAWLEREFDLRRRHPRRLRPHHLEHGRSNLDCSTWCCPGGLRPCFCRSETQHRLPSGYMPPASGCSVRCVTSTEARQAIDAGADVVVAQGGEAGGHGTGTRSTFTLVPEVADLIAERAPETLVLAAGGIADGRGLAAALSLGADGAVVGTRLLASHEAPVHAEAHRRILASTSDDTVRTTVLDIVRGRDWAAPYDGRLLRNDFLNRWQGHEDELRSSLADDTFRAGDRCGGPHGANMFVGEYVGLIHEVLPAATILQRMVLEASDALRRTGASASPAV